MTRLLRKYRRHKKHEVCDNSIMHMGTSCAQVESSRAIVPPEASLDGLPFEMKLAVFHEITDLPSLQALTHASPSYHRVYKSASHSILARVLLRDVHPDLLFDVLSMANVIKLALDNKPYALELKSYVERCKEKSKAPLAIDGLDSGTLEMLADVHRTIHHATDQFCRFTLSCHPVTGEPLETYKPLSHSEIRRIHRAFYRYELFGILFRDPKYSIADARTRVDGHIGSGLEQPNRMSILSHTKTFLFLALFKAWEVEEIACMRDYIIRRYKALIQQCEPELQKQCFRKVVPWLSLDASSRTDLETWNYNIKACQEQYSSLGLWFFNKTSKSSPKESFLMLRNNIRVVDCFLCGALAREPPGFLGIADNYGDPIDEAELQKIKEDLVGRPNAAWTWSNDYRDETWYFRPETEELRNRGYVFWDKERLDDWGALDEDKRLTGRYRRLLHDF